MSRWARDPYCAACSPRRGACSRHLEEARAKLRKRLRDAIEATGQDRALVSLLEAMKRGALSGEAERAGHRMAEAAEELMHLLQDEDLDGVPE